MDSCPRSREGDKQATEIKHTLDGRKLAFTCTVCVLDPPSRAVLSFRSAQGWTHRDPEIRVPPGSLTYAYFWSDLPYNVYHWVDPDGRTIGFYFNIAGRTEIRPGEVEWDDWEVDYWLNPDGHGVFLDQADLPADVDIAILDAIRTTQGLLREKAARVARDVEAETARWQRRLPPARDG